MSFRRIRTAWLALLLLCACKDGPTTIGLQQDPNPGPGPGPLVPTAWYVDESTGSDTNTGTWNFPFKTITRAFQAAEASSYKTIYVAPGTYDEANGEVFPMLVPQGVELIGDPATRGNGDPHAATLISGGSHDLPPGLELWSDSVAIIPGHNVRIAGFRIVNQDNGTTTPETAILVRSQSFRLEDSTITSSTNGLRYTGVSGNGHILRNTIKDNALWGINFDGAGAPTRVEYTTFRNNGVGVSLKWPGIDFGGGGTSIGRNRFECNQVHFWAWTQNNFAYDIYAMENYWYPIPKTGNSFGTIMIPPAVNFWWVPEYLGTPCDG